MKPILNRRELIQRALAGVSAVSLPIGLTACGSDDASDASNTIALQFLHGVASGDPLQDRVILWTRVTVADVNLRLELDWEIATDSEFKNIQNRGKAQTSSADDFTVKVDADKLKANQNYYYRFKFGAVISAVGRTKTLAEPSTALEQVRFAVCSCSNYPAGYFHVYKEMATLDVDAVLHLGDYIYEYGQGGYATEDAKALGREFASDNSQEILNLNDYRKRYALYRLDPDLQALHQRHPFVVIWDDHELSNDTWLDGAENHQANEGSFAERKAAALQAYFEWMPIRAKSAEDHLHIYRQFNYGNLVQLNMLDTRILARSEQLDYANYMTAVGGLESAKFTSDLYNSSRTLMGAEQFAWLNTSLANSQAKWNVLGQQVLMAKMLIPAEVLTILAKVQSGVAGATELAAIKQMITELSAIKIQYLTDPSKLTTQQLTRIQTVLPYNLDAWDGYAYEREALYGMLQKLKKQVVVLAGDTHNAWYSTLYAQNGQQAGLELATSSVSSPGMEKYLQISPTDLHSFEQAFALLIDELQYCNLSQRGYLLVEFKQTAVNANWVFVDTVKNKNYQIDSTTAKAVSFDSNFKTVVTVANSA
ncbi:MULTISPECIES: alkaline phosphatase D family protein [Acinetobacter]|uniref:alkaline phosphatase D family protein n=1 Tax=Acinetobacter TaxID=469 RepID=UPI000EA0C451|nr:MULTISPECIES: alkaline phosphatase D family protein [Acinetobacter]RKG46258.1 alkaline phosphatase [Acinetobacter cumulans]RZG61720.1 alkaline phosphatase [Acinetobacter sp. WCHAc060006]